jgi:hypothetical protein
MKLYKNPKLRLLTFNVILLGSKLIATGITIKGFKKWKSLSKNIYLTEIDLSSK